MIARLRGRAAARNGQTLVVDVNGVGYLVHATPSVQRLGDGEITIEIHTIVREDALQLYGFATADERELFELLLGVNGVGYLVHAAPSVQRLGGGEVTVEVHTVVREDALQLYGFATAEERELFELLLGVNGIGPKVALAIVSGSTPAELRRAIAREDVKRFQAIPGVGLKTAQRVVLELKEKLTLAADADAPEATDGPILAREALVELGWSLVDAERALAAVDPGLPVPEQVRLALRQAA